MQSTISVLIVYYKSIDLLLRCLHSIKVSNEVPAKIIVVDNFSGDNAKALVLGKFKDVQWYESGFNSGFGRANNMAALYSNADYLLILNSDVLLANTTIKNCFEFLEENSNVGVLGCKLLNEDGSHQKSTYSVAGFRKMLDQNLAINKLWPMKGEPVEAVMGSFMLIPRKVFEEVGGFDPDFFMYAEELDLCHRIAQKGYKILYFEGATAVHKNGGSTTNKEWSMKQRYLSNALLFLKVRGYSGYLLYHLLFLLNTLTNFVSMWWLDDAWRKSYWREQRFYFSNFGYYCIIPFLYSKKPGNGKRLLKRNS